MRNSPGSFVVTTEQVLSESPEALAQIREYLIEQTGTPADALEVWEKLKYSWTNLRENQPDVEYTHFVVSAERNLVESPGSAPVLWNVNPVRLTKQDWG